MSEVRGVVRAETGEPVAGALVMGLNLAYAETAVDGTFTLRNPELALFFWCVGYYPRTLVLNGGGDVEMTLRPVKQDYAPSTR